MKKITKQEKREHITRKLKIKKQRGATLAAQFKHTQNSKSFSGSSKKMVK